MPLQVPRRSHTKSLLRQLHWQPVQQRIMYKLAVRTTSMLTYMSHHIRRNSVRTLRMHDNEYTPVRAVFPYSLRQACFLLFQILIPGTRCQKLLWTLNSDSLRKDIQTYDSMHTTDSAMTSLTCRQHFWSWRFRNLTFIIIIKLLCDNDRQARDLIKELTSASTSYQVIRKFIQTTQVITTFWLGRRSRSVAVHGLMTWRVSAGCVSVWNDEFVVVSAAVMSWLGLTWRLAALDVPWRQRSLRVTEVKRLFRNLKAH